MTNELLRCSVTGLVKKAEFKSLLTHITNYLNDRNIKVVPYSGVSIRKKENVVVALRKWLGPDFSRIAFLVDDWLGVDEKLTNENIVEINEPTKGTPQNEGTIEPTHIAQEEELTGGNEPVHLNTKKELIVPETPLVEERLQENPSPMESDDPIGEVELVNDENGPGNHLDPLLIEPVSQQVGKTILSRNANELNPQSNRRKVYRRWEPERESLLRRKRKLIKFYKIYKDPAMKDAPDYEVEIEAQNHQWMSKMLSLPENQMEGALTNEALDLHGPFDSTNERIRAIGLIKGIFESCQDPIDVKPTFPQKMEMYMQDQPSGLGTIIPNEAKDSSLLPIEDEGHWETIFMSPSDFEPVENSDPIIPDLIIPDPIIPDIPIDLLEVLLERQVLTPLKDKRNLQLKTWTGVDEMLNFYRNYPGGQIGLKLGQEKILCLDIDNRLAGDYVLKVLENEERTLVTSSPRGIHVFFSLPMGGWDKNTSNQILRLGFEAEIKITTIVFLGKGYHRIDIGNPSQDETSLFFEKLTKNGLQGLPPIPEILWPLKHSKGVRLNIEPILTPTNDFVIKEGTRNTTLFYWGKRLVSQQTPPEVVREVLSKINDFCCKPPLDISELETISESVEKDRSLNPITTRKVSLTQIISILKEKWEATHVFNYEAKEWLIWQGQCWVTESELYVKKAILNEIENLDESLQRQQPLNEIYHMIEIRLGATKMHQPIPGFLNFRNGVFDVTTQILWDHNPLFFQRTMIDCDYDPQAYPSLVVRDILTQWVGGSKESLSHLRVGIRRSIEPSIKFQTGIWIYGPPATGKSTFVSWLSYVLGPKCVEFSCQRNSLFDRARYMDAFCILFSDANRINSEANRLLKNLIGRDTIAYDRKYIQTSDSFVCKAMVFATSNQDVTGALLDNADTGLLDRFIEIKFPFVPRHKNADILDLLKKETAGLVNWCLTAPKEMFQEQIRVTGRALKGLTRDPYVDFLTTHCRNDGNSFVRIADLLNAFIEFTRTERTLTLKPSDNQHMVNRIQNSLSKFFGITSDVQRIRIPNERMSSCLIGIRLCTSHEQSNLELLPEIGAAMNEDFEGLDPWAINPIYSYRETDTPFEPFEGLPPGKHMSLGFVDVTNMLQIPSTERETTLFQPPIGKESNESTDLKEPEEYTSFKEWTTQEEEVVDGPQIEGPVAMDGLSDDSGGLSGRANPLFGAPGGGQSLDPTYIIEPLGGLQNSIPINPPEVGKGYRAQPEFLQMFIDAGYDRITPFGGKLPGELMGDVRGVIERSIKNLHGSGFDLGPLSEYNYSVQYIHLFTVHQAYEQMKVMPLKYWPELVDVTNMLQTPDERENFYSKLKEEPRNKTDRRWETKNRKNGITGFLFPIHYERTNPVYPRLQGRGLLDYEKRQPVGTGLVGTKRSFKNIILDDLSRKFFAQSGYAIYEIDMISCHTILLASLQLKTNRLNETLSKGENVWNNVKNEMNPPVVNRIQEATKELEVDFVKLCIKRICYKSLQGGRTNSVEKIYYSLEDERRILGDVFLLGAASVANQIPIEAPEMSKDEFLQFEIRDYELLTPKAELSRIEKAKAKELIELKVPERKLASDMLHELAYELSKNIYVKEFDQLNMRIRQQFEMENYLLIYIPWDAKPLRIVPHDVYQNQYASRTPRGAKRKTPGVTDNLCRAASQILVGLETMLLMLIIEGIVQETVPWIPVSLHHDGFAFLSKAENLEEYQLRIEKHLSIRGNQLGIKPVKLEITPYMFKSQLDALKSRPRGHSPQASLPLESPS